MAWQIKENIYSVEVFLTKGSYQYTQLAFERNFNSYKPPTRFENSAENIRVQEFVHGLSPKTSVPRKSQDLGIARESLRTILTDDLKLHPNRIRAGPSLSAEASLSP